MKNYKIAVAGTGYVGLSLGVLLSQHHQVVAVDIVQAKVDMINNKKSPIQDDYIEKYLAEKDLNLTATLDAKTAYGTIDVCFAAGPHDPFAEERLGGCAGPGICALSVGRAGGRSSEQHFQCHPCPAGTGSRTADRTAIQWLFQAKPDISRRSPDCAEMRNRDGPK